MEVSSECRLRGKVNFVTWKREFEREARAHDVLDILTGAEDVLQKPRKEDYVDDDDEKESNTIASTQKSLKNFHANTLRYTIDYNNWKSNKDSLRTANKLLNAWIDDNIRIEIETSSNARDAYALIIARHRVSEERARNDLLSGLRKLTINDCENVSDYLNKLRRFKSDLAGVDYKLSDSLYATALLDGLDDRKWESFKEKWETIRAIQLDANPNATPSIDLLEERLQYEAQVKQRREDERKKQDRDRNKAKGKDNAHGRFTPSHPRTEDRSHFICRACGKKGHIENNCWKLHPEKMPRALKDRRESAGNNRSNLQSANFMHKKEQDRIAAFADSDVASFDSELAVRETPDV